MKKIVLFAAALSLSVFLAGADRLTGRMFAGRSEVIATQGMVAASQPLAAQIGIDILKKGGTAVDAAIAVNAALGLMEPTGAGIGGDLFAIVWDSKISKFYGLNGSGPAPRAISLDYFQKNDIRRVPGLGPLPWTVPGCVEGWFAAARKVRQAGDERCSRSGHRLCRKRFPAIRTDRHVLAAVGAPTHRLTRIFRNSMRPEAGHRQRATCSRIRELAATYRLLARAGRDAFYRGEIARRIVAYSTESGRLLLPGRLRRLPAPNGWSR